MEYSMFFAVRRARRFARLGRARYAVRPIDYRRRRHRPSYRVGLVILVTTVTVWRAMGRACQHSCRYRSPPHRQLTTTPTPSRYNFICYVTPRNEQKIQLPDKTIYHGRTCSRWYNGSYPTECTVHRFLSVNSPVPEL